MLRSNDFDKNEYQCPICNKRFYAYSEDYVYKRTVDKKTVRFCSYGCTRCFDKKSQHERLRLLKEWWKIFPPRSTKSATA